MTTSVRLGQLVGARSGDKGGNANLGVWAKRRDFEIHSWMVDALTPDRLVELLPECGGLVIERFELPNLFALNFVIRGLLGWGVASNLLLDSQAKGLGERLRACWIDVPLSLGKKALV